MNANVSQETLDGLREDRAKAIERSDRLAGKYQSMLSTLEDLHEQVAELELEKKSLLSENRNLVEIIKGGDWQKGFKAGLSEARALLNGMRDRAGHGTAEGSTLNLAIQLLDQIGREKNVAPDDTEEWTVVEPNQADPDAEPKVYRELKPRRMGPADSLLQLFADALSEVYGELEAAERANINLGDRVHELETAVKERDSLLDRYRHADANQRAAINEGRETYIKLEREREASQAALSEQSETVRSLQESNRRLRVKIAEQMRANQKQTELIRAAERDLREAEARYAKLAEREGGEFTQNLLDQAKEREARIDTLKHELAIAQGQLAQANEHFEERAQALERCEEELRNCRAGRKELQAALAPIAEFYEGENSPSE